MFLLLYGKSGAHSWDFVMVTNSSHGCASGVGTGSHTFLSGLVNKEVNSGSLSFYRPMFDHSQNWGSFCSMGHLLSVTSALICVRLFALQVCVCVTALLCEVSTCPWCCRVPTVSLALTFLVRVSVVMCTVGTQELLTLMYHLVFMAYLEITREKSYSFQHFFGFLKILKILIQVDLFYSKETSWHLDCFALVSQMSGPLSPSFMDQRVSSPLVYTATSVLLFRTLVFLMSGSAAWPVSSRLQGHREHRAVLLLWSAELPRADLPVSAEHSCLRVAR